MPSRFTTMLNSRATMIGIVLGVAYGLFARIVISFSPRNGDWFGVMTIAFLGLVPIGIGILTTAQSEDQSLRYRVMGPWGPMFLTLVGTIVFALEGAICIFLAIPLVFPLASIGGLIGGLIRRQGIATRSLILAIPFLVSPLEMRVGNPLRMIETVREVTIDAPPAKVWPLVASVDSIRPEEQSKALFISIGFPKPISATLSHPGVGGVRSAKFEKGLVFTETVTDWVPERRLSFTIDPNTESIPPNTLDEHVTIGGPYFDVLTGTYELIPLDSSTRTRLVLRSTHRVSTHFNPYAAWWAERIMASIQTNILDVLEKRAEKSEALVASH
jgi:hypothetical protein